MKNREKEIFENAQLLSMLSEPGELNEITFETCVTNRAVRSASGFTITAFLRRAWAFITYPILSKVKKTGIMAFPQRTVSICFP